MSAIQQMLFAVLATKKEVTYLGSTASAGSLSGLDIGPARPDRFVVVAANRELDASGTQATPTVNGTPINIVSQPTSSDPWAIGYLQLDASYGSSINVAATSRVGAVLITGVNSYAGSIAGTVSSATFNFDLSSAPASSVFVGGGRTRSSSATTWTVGVTGVGRDATFDYGTLSGGGNSGHALGHCFIDAAGSGVFSLTNASALSSGLGTGLLFT